MVWLMQDLMDPLRPLRPIVVQNGGFEFWIAVLNQRDPVNAVFGE
jgi:hypothetical protein